MYIHAHFREIVIYIYLKEIQKHIQNKYKDGYNGAYGGKFLGVEPVSLLANLKAWPVQQSSNKLHFAYFCISIIVQFCIFRISADCRASWGAVSANSCSLAWPARDIGQTEVHVFPYFCICEFVFVVFVFCFFVLSTSRLTRLASEWWRTSCTS